MKIYVASLSPPEEFRGFYSSAATEIKKLGHTPYDPFGADGALLSWPTRLDDLTKECQGLYLHQGWCNCIQAVTERHLCLAAGKVIFFQSTQREMATVDQKKAADIERIKEAIHEATGMTLEQYRVHSRKTELVFARMIFSHYGKRAGLSPEEISICLDRNKSMIYHYFNRYGDECKYTPAFRKIALQVEQILV